MEEINEMVNIIGISAYYHDSACCLLQNGKLVCAAEEERFSRIKHDSSLPQLAFDFCLKQANLTIKDIDCIAYYENPHKKLARQLWSGFYYSSSSIDFLTKLDPKRPEREIRTLLGYEGPIEFFDHHQSHAASSYYFSGFREASIFTVDGVGEWATTTYGKGHGKDIELFEEIKFPHSLGLLYSTITGYLGFDVNDAEYKVMGLAPYGIPKYKDKIYQLIHLSDDGQYRLNLDYFDFIGGRQMYSPQLCELFNHAPRQPESELCQFTKDMASSLQVVLEEILLQKINYLYNKNPSDNLCMSGGVALNCVANGKIKKMGPFKNIFIQPAASDAGSALGAAALAHVHLTKRRPSEDRLLHVYLGPNYNNNEVLGLLGDSQAKIMACEHESQLLAQTVDRLVQGKVIGWFQGKMEFGPRSLGGRSILADPRRHEMRDRINALVKKREAFRPFAPAVLLKKAYQHFDLDSSSPFMLETCKVISDLELPAITHVDQSARVQTVDETTNPRFTKLLEEFDLRTGCPILLNTSFNVRGEPIVCTPIDALLCFIRSDIDCLVLEDVIIDRENLPRSWIEWFRDTKPLFNHKLSQSVYTFL